MKNKNYGACFFELCICLVILAIITCFALPNFTEAIANVEGKRTLINILQLMNFAKALAIKTHAGITLCPSHDHIHCTDNWHSPIMVFRADNNTLYAYTSVLYGNGQLQLHIFPKNAYLQFNSTGQFMAHNGTLQYCPHNGDAHISHALIISNTGKIHYSQDHDHDGIDENANGKPLTCP